MTTEIFIQALLNGDLKNCEECFLGMKKLNEEIYFFFEHGNNLEILKWLFSKKENVIIKHLSKFAELVLFANKLKGDAT